MNEIKTIIHISARTVIKHTGEIEELLDKELEELESRGWEYSIESIEDE